MSASPRKKNVALLTNAGFRVAAGLPTVRDEHGKMRPLREIAGRLVALQALYLWVAAPESAVPSAAVRRCVVESDAKRWLTPLEARVVAAPRKRAHEENVDTVGWRLENMWPLAWVLGFPEEPSFDGAMIDGDVIRAMVPEFLGLADARPEELVARKTARNAVEVDALEDLFYCAHNAARSAQLGGKTVPKGFDPIAGGGVIHERRHALTWCMSPKTKWEDTDLST